MRTSSRRSRRHPSPRQEGHMQEPFFGPVKADHENVASQPFFQPKLTIGQPGDAYEQEADKVADAVVSGSERTPAVQRQGISRLQRVMEVQKQPAPEEEEPVQMQEMEEEKEAVQTQAEPKEEEKPVQKQEMEEEEVQAQMEPEKEEEPVQMQPQEEENKREKAEDIQAMAEPEEEELLQGQPEGKEKEREEEKLQTKAEAGGGGKAASPQLANQLHQSSGSGRALPENTRAEMESAFGVDFGDVRIHTGHEADQMNKELGAQAFTHGRDVYFREGKYKPETQAGKHLLAHELTHVIQQSKDIQPKIQCYTVPAGLPCDEVASWIDANSPYAPGWAQTNSDYSFNGNLRVSPPEQVEGGGVRLTASGHNGLTVSVRITIDRPHWNPSPRPNRAAERAAWQSAMSVLDAHEQEHRAIGEQWRVTLEERFRAINLTVSGASQADAREQLRAQLDQMLSGWQAEAQAAQTAIDPFSTTLTCPAPTSSK
ncbi:MAG: DUF4157 domain-containing protein [Lewinellaceae bacterium]|nr:DUF4157 domain-containing protein [Lewinellaceae bacterium]